MPVVVFGWNISSYSKTNQFIILAGGSLTCSLGFAFLQEKVTHIPGFSHYDLMTFLTTLTFTICGYLERFMMNDLKRKASLQSYFLLSLCTMGGMLFTNFSLNYLNYTTRIVFKSSKVIPVMLVGVVMQGRTYLALEYLSVFVLVAGIVFFTLGDSSESPNYSPIGLLLISGGVVLDAVTANFEEKSFFHAKNCSPAEVMCYASMFGTVFGFFGLILNQDMVSLLEFLIATPEVVLYTVSFATLGYCSSLFVLLLIKNFGATNAEIVKSVRKILSVAISFLAFAKPFTAFHMYGTALFVISTLFGVHVKNEKARLKKKVMIEREQDGMKA